MALDYSDKKLDRYFDALFVVGRMGDSKRELANLQKVMSPENPSRPMTNSSSGIT